MKRSCDKWRLIATSHPSSNGTCSSPVPALGIIPALAFCGNGISNQYRQAVLPISLLLSQHLFTLQHARNSLKACYLALSLSHQQLKCACPRPGALHWSWFSTGCARCPCQVSTAVMQLHVRACALEDPCGPQSADSVTKR